MDILRCLYSQAGRTSYSRLEIFVLVGKDTAFLFSFNFGTIQVSQCAGLFGFIRYFLGCCNAVYHSDRHKPQSGTIMKSKESLPPTVILFGGQSGRLKAIQASQATMESNVRHHHLDLKP